MKLAPLLAEYLYTHKRLDLPGIGTFHLDPSVILEDENNKHGKPAEVTGITFENNPSIKESQDLISFISTRTGKMKALATADLESHLELIQQFLNIGKPFLLEGIGSLVKIKSGQYEFISGGVVSEKIKEFSAKEIAATSSTEESFGNYKKDSAIKWKRPVALLLVVAGIAAAVIAGYKIYKHRATKEDVVSAPEEKKEETVPVQVQEKDTTQLVVSKKDSVVEKPVAETQSIPTGNYKFVVETATKERGLLRYTTLKGYGLNIQMETKDSIDFKLFFILPAAITDTSKMIDSLRILYTPYWSRAYVER